MPTPSFEPDRAWRPLHLLAVLEYRLDPRGSNELCRLLVAHACGLSTPGVIRTRDLRIRNPLLYPTELRGLVVIDLLFAASVRSRKAQHVNLSRPSGQRMQSRGCPNAALKVGQNGPILHGFPPQIGPVSVAANTIQISSLQRI